MGNSEDLRILGGQSRRSSVWIVGIQEEESENEGKEFIIEIMWENFPRF